ncbi:MAG: arginine--tRNA ligase [Candidatus Parcubacteria bacterium]|nr:arginine--tRNA ligase [Candidatus Parcubacteria bacterium]
MIKETIQKEIIRILGGNARDFVVEKSSEFGDYATNAAMMNAKGREGGPREFAEFLISELWKSEEIKNVVEKMGVAGPGFINFYLKNETVSGYIGEILEKGAEYGKNEKEKGEKVVIEYTDPNPFKEFHIGHLMTNTLGEALSRIIEANGAEVKRACYQGDVGMHVAKTVWAISKKQQAIKDANDLGKAYSYGAQNYEEFKEEIQEINKKIYDRSDEEINKIYDEGRKISLEYFEHIYKRLGTHFDYYFFESETGVLGKKIVEENLDKVFRKSDGAVVFPGEEHGLHTRVFLNSEGLPTYEAKELGLAKIKYDAYPYDTSVVVTGNEVNDYFQVLLRAMSLVFPELEKKTEHVSHGMLRLPTGKMSSRTGDVITAEALIGALSEMVMEKIADRDIEDKGKVAEEIAVAGIKYSILKQSPGKDIIFDPQKALSFEGDSGAYLQYAYVRTQSILRKAEIHRVVLCTQDYPVYEPVSVLEKLLFEGLPNAVLMARRELSPNYVATYLVDLCREFNAYYEQNQILGNEHTEHRLALVKAVGVVLKNGLTLLGIPVLEKM